MTETATTATTAATATDAVMVSVPGTDTPLVAQLINGEPYAALRPMCDAIGLDYSSQWSKLKTKSWANVAISPTVAADGKVRDMVLVDRRTLTMWLATITETRIAPDLQPTIRAFQAEAADALDAYFHEGGAINPNATDDQLDRLTERARAQMELIQSAKGIINPEHLETRARLVLARGLGEVPEIEPEDMPLYTQTYLEDRGVDRERIQRIAGAFGKKVKMAYRLKYGKEPGKYPITALNGQVRMAYAYVEADRPLLDEIYREFYADEAVKS
jgi:hypothetical protein